MIRKLVAIKEISGAITNNYNLPATNIMLRVNFSFKQNDKPFHYEVFAPFDNINEQVQPGSTKSFEKCMNYNLYESGIKSQRQDYHGYRNTSSG